VGRVSVVRDRAEDLRKVIALVQDGGPKLGSHGNTVLIDHLMSIRRSNQQNTVDILIQDSISINGEEILRAGTSGFEEFLGDAKRSHSLDKSGA